MLVTAAKHCMTRLRGTHAISTAPSLALLPCQGMLSPIWNPQWIVQSWGCCSLPHRWIQPQVSPALLSCPWPQCALYIRAPHSPEYSAAVRVSKKPYPYGNLQGIHSQECDERDAA